MSLLKKNWVSLSANKNSMYFVSVRIELLRIYPIVCIYDIKTVLTFLYADVLDAGGLKALHKQKIPEVSILSYTKLQFSGALFFSLSYAWSSHSRNIWCHKLTVCTYVPEDALWQKSGTSDCTAECRIVLRPSLPVLIFRLLEGRGESKEELKGLLSGW